MKVVILSNNYNGLVHFRSELIHTLISCGSELVLVAPYDESKPMVASLGCKVVDFPFNRKGTNMFKDINLLFKYRSLIYREKPDIVLSYTIKPNLYGGMACRLCHKPQIANITGLGSAVENPGMLQRLTVWLYRICLKKTNMVFFQNENNLRFCTERKMVGKNYRLIPGSGVNLSEHTVKSYPKADVIRFIFIGRVMYEKGIDQYLITAKTIKFLYPSTEFMVMGRCEENYQELLSRMEGEGIIKYVGQQPDVRPFLELANCTIHPSFYPEGMSNVLLESCAAGRPIITTDRPGCREIVDDGVNGFIVKQRDAKDLIEKVTKFLSLSYEEKKEMGLAGRRKVEREFDRQIVVNAYLEEINNIKKPN